MEPDTDPVKIGLVIQFTVAVVVTIIKLIDLISGMLPNP